jgi:hypothetical protein
MQNCVTVHSTLRRLTAAAAINIGNEELVNLPSGSLRYTLTISDSSRDSSSGSSATNFDTACTWGQSIQTPKRKNNDNGLV